MRDIKIRTVLNNKKLSILIVLFLILEHFILIGLRPSNHVLIIFGCILLSSMIVLKWYKISLKRFFLLIFLPAISLSIILLFIKLTPNIFNQGFIFDIDFFNKLAGLLLKVIGGSLLLTLFEIYIMFPSLVLFSTIILMSEKIFALHSRLMSLMAPFIGISLVYLEFSFMYNSSKPFEKSIGILIFTGIAAFLAVSIEQYLQNKTKDNQEV